MNMKSIKYNQTSQNDYTYNSVKQKYKIIWTSSIETLDDKTTKIRGQYIYYKCFQYHL